MALNTYPYSPFPASTEQLHKGDNENLQAQIDAIKDGTNIDSFGDVETALEEKTDTAVIAPDFDAEAGVYSVGDLVTYDGKLYEFTSDHGTAGEWDPTEVTEKTVADEIGTVKSGLINYVDVTYTTEANAGVAPFAYFSTVTIPYTDIPSTAKIISTAFVDGNSSVYGVATVRTTVGQSNWGIYVLTGKEVVDGTLRIAYLKG